MDLIREFRRIREFHSIAVQGPPARNYSHHFWTNKREVKDAAYSHCLRFCYVFCHLGPKLQASAPACLRLLMFCLRLLRFLVLVQLRLFSLVGVAVFDVRHFAGESVFFLALGGEGPEEDRVRPKLTKAGKLN